MNLQSQSPKPSVSSNLERISYLDGLRFFAVLGPMLHHLYPKTSDFSSRLLHLGSIGVDIFFVLSGFLISLILIMAKDSGTPWRRIVRAFYVRRFVRIFPVYWLVLVCCHKLGLLSSGDFLWNFTYLSNFWIVSIEKWPGVFSHLWSLAVEEQFYLFWPLFVLWTPKKHLAKGMSVVVLVGVLWRIVCWNMDSPEGRVMGVVLPMGCIDEFAIGGLLALYWREAAERELRWLLPVFLVSTVFVSAHIALFLLAESAPPSLMLISPIFRTSIAMMTASSIGLIHFRAELGFLDTFFRWPPFQYVGRISYGTYLLHPFIPLILIQWGGLRFAKTAAPGWQNLLIFLTYAVFTILLATVSWYCFEQPLNRLKRYAPYVKNS